MNIIKLEEMLKQFFNEDLGDGGIYRVNLSFQPIN